MGLMKGNRKAQLMTIVMLVIFVLMLSALLVFAMINTSSNAVSQSLAISYASNNYGSLLRLSANNFASASLSKAITALATYEATPGTRKVNFITNTSLYFVYLMVNGTLPNDTSGYPQNAMGNLTFSLYNKSIANAVGLVASAVNVSESRPRFFQTDPYHISVSYVEHVSINASGNSYLYNIPVNVSLPLNNTPDLFYAQQGSLRNIRFANIANLTSIVSSTYATAGNTVGYDYGTVYTAPSSGGSSLTCGSLTGSAPAWVTSSPLQSTLIISTYNAQGLGSCINSYGGLITYMAPSTTPTVPYLVYPTSSNIISNTANGTNLLLYGPGLDTLNIESLRAAIMSGLYFASPFAPGYLDRAQGNFGAQSPNGAFTFANYHRQVANFAGASGDKITLASGGSVPARLKPAGAISISAWIYSRVSSGSSNSIVSTGGAGSACGYGIANSNNPLGYSFFICNSNTNHYSANVMIGKNSWHMLTGVFNGTSQLISFYEDGNLIGTLTAGVSTITYSSPSSIAVGETPSNGQAFNGFIANLQIYNSSLTNQQVQKLYQEGLAGLPVSNNALVGWWPLNSNYHDYSGYNLNGTAVGVNTIQPPNYTRDSIFVATAPTQLSPLPGVLCMNNAQCSDNTQPQLYLGYMPLEMQSNLLQVAEFNSLASYSVGPAVKTAGNIALSSNSFSFTAWFNPMLKCGTSGTQVLLSQNTQGGFTTPWMELLCPLAPNTWQFELENGGGTYTATSSGQPTPNTWHFAAITYASATGAMKLYIDGSQPYTATATGSEGTSAPLYIGSGESFFPGNIANVQYYNSTLSPFQVNALYQEGIAGLPLQANIMDWWPLDGNATDFAGNDNGIATNVVYPYISSNGIAPGLSSVSVPSNEWQALGLSNT